MPRQIGFALIDPAVRRQISSKGGKAAHAAGVAHEFTAEEARAAGSKGGRASHANRRAASTDKTSAEERTGDLFEQPRVALP